MRQISRIIALILCMVMLLSGCSTWLSGDYNSVTPYHDEGTKHTDESATVNSYMQLRDALLELMESGMQEGILYITDVTEDQCTYYMETAINYLMQNTAIGAYAVNNVSFDVGTNAGKLAIAIKIEYLHNRSEILRIKQTKSMDDVQKLIRVALENNETRLVTQVQEYRARDLVLFVENYVNENPQICMELPQVSVATYPESGSERIIEIVFLYQTSRESLRSMKQIVDNVFKSAQYYVNIDIEDLEKYTQLYTFLMERYDYTYETSITPAYSLLRHGVGDCRAFALVYMAMCRQVGLDCKVVSGTKNGEPWYWNVLNMDDVYYHVDLLECNAQGAIMLQTEENMTGYVWDYSAF